MTVFGFDNMTITGENLLPHQKINGTCTLKATPADNLKIEIPIKRLTSATYNKDNKVNKLVTVFAVSFYSYDGFVPRQQKHAPCFTYYGL